MGRQRNLSINLIASIISFTINFGISFFLTPYIIKKIGTEAYGFVSLGANFINYVSLVTIALNSMAGRFITIEIHKGNWIKANKYFNSVVLSNFIVAGLLLVPSILIVAYIEKIVNVPFEILKDVRILFSFLFANYLVGIISSSFSVSTFATNKLYLASLRQIESTLIKLTILVLLFAFFKPAVSYIGFATFFVSLYIGFFNLYYTKKLLPKITIKKAYYDIKKVFELISSGFWNTILRLGQILSDGMDLLIANLFISATAMGTLALAKTIPIVIYSLIGSIVGVFMPGFTLAYAQNDNIDLLKQIKSSMKIMGIFTNIPIVLLCVCGDIFYTLWAPTQNPKELQILSVLTVSHLIVSGSIHSLYNVFTITNKLKANTLAVIITGFINIILVLIILNSTNLGIYAIAGVSTVVGTISNLTFTPIYAAKCLGLSWRTFYPQIFSSITSFLVILIFSFLLKSIYVFDGWFDLILFSLICLVVGVILQFLIDFNKQERQYILFLIKRKIIK